MGVINYAGSLSAAVILTWQGETVANAISTTLKKFPYTLANESVTEFVITATTSAKNVVLTRKATKTHRFFDDALNTYTTLPTSGIDIEDLVAAGTRASCTIDLTFTYARFFDAMLEQMTLTGPALNNLANPRDSKAILDTFTHSASAGKISIDYKTATQSLKSLPCRLVKSDVKPGLAGKPPAVTLTFELDFLNGIDSVRREAMRKLIAMDWSKIAKLGTDAAASKPEIQLWRQSVFAYLVNYSDLSRGEQFRASLVNRHKGKSAVALATDLRDDIDGLVVTANHWGQAREDLKTERHQRLLSDLFGTLHQSTWVSSPVSFIRNIRKSFRLSPEQGAALVLQYGAGHCGEHAQVSFSVLSDIIKTPGTQISHAVFTGNANIDHAFVVYDLDVDTVVHTLATAANNSRVNKGGEIAVWNLRDAISRNAPRRGFVMDPYLDKSVMKPTADALLAALNNKSRKASVKDTDFLAFAEEYPPNYAFLDLRGQSEAERKKRVKNV
ncbi:MULTISPECIES: hypothetical protein [unclassified Corallococcus]|uniref:hypothetical protein n=1 Tax=unclassified Corallococcus TaxID=2685029 RepID=UPI001A8D31C5|nr:MULTISPECIES: hypothetical protein [unclassified Corallococcus]MBN9685947.1 hypothetical protein [Corallococcus sp. NCSPR001]WAS82613.1 hypothetical protein O0N60_25195 [Corallococcus sp. NCRR]